MTTINIPQPVEECKLQAKGIRKLGKIVCENGRFFFYFGYWPALNEEIKNMEGRRYHGYDEKNPRKVWSAPITARNIFHLEYLKGNDPYKNYNEIPKSIESDYPLYSHQQELSAHWYHVQYGIWAGEMGIGKTLSAIAVAEKIFNGSQGDPFNFYWTGTRSSLRGVQADFEKWKTKLKPLFMTYEGMTSMIKKWEPGRKAPRVVVFDECSKIKSPAAQRSIAAKTLADGVRQDWGRNGYVLLMSGTPAPKTPLDWWYPCETACPGFIREGNIHSFRNRLAIVVERENPTTGGKYPEIIAWKDNENRCEICGENLDHEVHRNINNGEYHVFKKSVNEVAKLYSRLKGLVVVKFKKDCLDLPDKRYVIERVQPKEDTLRAYNLILKTAGTAIRALTLTRELSDGFQYTQKESGTKVCPTCQGTGEQEAQFNSETGERILEATADVGIKIETSKISCEQCEGSGEVANYEQTTEYVETPKDEIVRTYLENHDDVGRLVVYAGFKGSIDKLVTLCQKEEWNVIRVDGRGWQFTDTQNQIIKGDPLAAFQNTKDGIGKIVFIGQPSSAGFGITLTASPTVLFYSNDFSGEARMQAEDRIHRIGMDKNLGATIVDIFHLPTDELVLNNLKKKKRLQDMTLGELGEIIK